MWERKDAAGCWCCCFSPVGGAKHSSLLSSNFGGSPWIRSTSIRSSSMRDAVSRTVMSRAQTQKRAGLKEDCVSNSDFSSQTPLLQFWKLTFSRPFTPWFMGLKPGTGPRVDNGPHVTWQNLVWRWNVFKSKEKEELWASPRVSWVYLGPSAQ